MCNKPQMMCSTCTRTRSALYSRRHRAKKQYQNETVKINPSSTVRYSILTKQEMAKRLQAMQANLTIIKKQRDRLQRKVNSLVDSNNTLHLNRSDSEDLHMIMANESCTTPFQKLFWEQQIEAARKKGKQGMRWHPLMIRWCLYLRYQSQKAYETMRQSGIILPSQRTLRDYTHCVNGNPGFSSEVDEQLCLSVGLDKYEDWQKHVIILMDEVHIKEDLVFDKHSGKFIEMKS